jgi:plastocyanin
MRCRSGVSTVLVLCVFSLVAMGWTHLTDWDLSLSKAAATDALSPLSEQPGKHGYQEPVVPQDTRPSTRSSDEALRGAGGTGQTGLLVSPTSRVTPAEDHSKAESPTVIGQVLFRGAVPPPTLLEINRDTDICGQVSKLQQVSVDPVTHGLGQAIVHVDVAMVEGAAAPMEVAGDTSPVRNKHCAFHPRIDVAGPGSVAEFINDDPLMHNTHVTSGNRTMVNVALVAGGNRVRKPFKKPGLYLVKCNVHKFMSGYRYVFDDSFYAMTNEAGQFRITGLPPGIHTLTVWHETLGTIHKEVQVPTKGTVRVHLEFK